MASVQVEDATAIREYEMPDGVPLVVEEIYVQNWDRNPDNKPSGGWYNTALIEMQFVGTIPGSVRLRDFDISMCLQYDTDSISDHELADYRIPVDLIFGSCALFRKDGSQFALLQKTDYCLEIMTEKEEDTWWALHRCDPDNFNQFFTLVDDKFCPKTGTTFREGWRWDAAQFTDPDGSG